MQDLTKITTPFGLLDEETRKALREYEGDVELYLSDGWLAKSMPTWFSHFVYRAKPQPPKPREWWLNVYGNGCHAHRTQEQADYLAATNRLACVHVREVIDE